MSQLDYKGQVHFKSYFLGVFSRNGSATLFLIT